MIELLHLNLDEDKMSEVANSLLDKLQFAVDARINQVDGHYKRWQDNYTGKPKEEVRTTPFPNASNFVPQLIRMHTDILSARMCGIIFSTKPFWRVKSWIKTLPHECLDSLNEWMEYKSFSELAFFEPIDLTIFQAVKTGTVILKAPWVDQTFTTADVRGQLRTTKREGIELAQIPFDDFYPWPITARNLSQVRIKFHRLRFAKEEVEWRKNNAVWNTEASDALLQTPDPAASTEAKREVEAVEAGITLSQDTTRPYNAIEAWFDYPLDGRNNCKLVFVLNPKRRGKSAVLRAYYNFYKTGLDPFIDFRLMPRDDLFYGYSVPEILEQSQEEQAQIHNARRDANTIANVPGWKKRTLASVPNPSQEWYPGKVFDVDEMDDLEMIQFQGNYNSMIEEEQYLLQLTERYTGIQTPMQGFGAGAMEGKRGIYSSQGTLALLAEGNKRLDIFNRRFRFPFHRLGNLIFQSYKDFGKNDDEIAAFGDKAEYLRQVFNIEAPQDYKGLFFDIGASDAGTNRELDRQNLLLMANTMASYYRQIVESATLYAQIPEGNPLRELLVAVLDGAKDLADRLLFTFEIGDRDRLLPDMRKVLAGEAGRGGVAQPPGMPQAQGPVGLGELRGLSSGLAALSGRGIA